MLETSSSYFSTDPPLTENEQEKIHKLMLSLMCQYIRIIEANSFAIESPNLQTLYHNFTNASEEAFITVDKSQIGTG